MKNLFCLTLAIFAAVTGFSQMKDYNVVFDMSSRDSISQQAVIREVGLIKEFNPDARLEVVIYGQGLGIIKTNSPFASQIQKLIKMPGVNFKVCQYTLNRNNISVDQLVPGVTAVPDGIYEIISKQKEGWGYIKVAH